MHVFDRLCGTKIFTQKGAVTMPNESQTQQEPCGAAVDCLIVVIQAYSFSRRIIYGGNIYKATGESAKLNGSSV